MFVWMLYVIVVSLVLSVAALAAEHMVRLRRASNRWIWALAIALSLVIPAVIASVSVQLPVIVNGVSPPASQKLIALREVTAVTLSPTAWVGASPANAAMWRTYDLPLQLAWLAASAVMLFLLLLSGVHLYWRKRHWTCTTMAGMNVYTALNVGPAVVGLLRPRIVVPQWLGQSPASVQSAVIAHEQAHLETNDPQLFMLALGLLLFMPWNLPLWWQLRRLRRAIEVDCDARVLKKGIDPVNYSETLFAVGQHQSAYVGSVAAMSESTSFLEERLKIMLKQPAKWWRPASVALGCLSVLLVALATQVSPPNAVNSGNHEEITLEPAVLDGYVGTYKLGETGVFTITRDGAQLNGQLTGQPSLPMYPERTTEFFSRSLLKKAILRWNPWAVTQAPQDSGRDSGQSTHRERRESATSDFVWPLTRTAPSVLGYGEDCKPRNRTRTTTPRSPDHVTSPSADHRRASTIRRAFPPAIVYSR